MKIFKYKRFHQWAKSEGLEDHLLKKVIAEIENGLFDVNLGSGLYKKRVARKGQGKRGSYRTLIAFKRTNKAIFMYGFAKSERDNIDKMEEDIFKRLAKYYFDTSELQLSVLVKNGELIEVI